MAISDITLGAGMRENLSSLQLTSALMARTSERLATGLKVNKAVDDPTAFFAAQAHRSRAADLAALKDGMGEGIQTVNAANEGIEAITTLIEQARGLVSAARSIASVTDRADLFAQFNEILNQIDTISADSGYKGLNLLAADTMTVTFDEAGSSTLDIVGFDATVAGDLAITAATDFSDGELDTAVTELDAAVTTLRTNAKTLSANLGIVTARQEFTTGMINTLQVGADNLTVADENEESANMLALQTRQQISIATLGMSSQAQQSILRLF
jgi:flagellin-like hook-associated protein FlgL